MPRYFVNKHESYPNYTVNKEKDVWAGEWSYLLPWWVVALNTIGWWLYDTAQQQIHIRVNTQSGERHDR